MSLLTSVPNYPVDQETPFLLQVKFDDYERLIASIADGRDEPSVPIVEANRNVSTKMRPRVW